MVDKDNYRLDIPDPYRFESGGATVRDLAEYMRRVDDLGRKQNDKKEVFAEIMRENSVDDAYIILRQFSSSFAHPERALGVGTKLLDSAVGATFFDSSGKARKLRKEYGDSLARGLQKEDVSVGGEDMSVVDLYKRLLEIEKASADSRIIRLISDTMFDISKPWVFSQMLRRDIGMYCGDSTIIGGLSKVADGYTHDEIRRAYGIQNDAPLVFLDWAKEDRELNTEVRPHTMIGEMKAKKVSSEDALELEADNNWLAQTKYDGARCFIHHAGDGDVRAYLAGNRDVTFHLPELFEGEMKEQLPDFPFILDSEVVPYNPDTGGVLPFQHILKRTGMKTDGMYEPDERDIDVKFRLFDILNWEGEDITQEPYSERLRILRTSFNPDIVARTGDDIEAVYEKSLEAGHEGVVLKKRSSEFEFNVRSTSWLKWKADPMEADLYIMDVHEGGGKAANAVGALTLGTKDKHGHICVGAVGTGFTDSERKRLWDKHQRGELEGMVCQVSFEELQVSDDGVALRFPSYDSLRPEGEVDTLERLIRISGLDDELSASDVRG